MKVNPVLDTVYRFGGITIGPKWIRAWYESVLAPENPVKEYAAWFATGVIAS